MGRDERAEQNEVRWNINIMLKLNTRWAMTYTLNMKCDYDRCAHDKNTNKVEPVMCGTMCIMQQIQGIFTMRIHTDNLQFFVMFRIETRFISHFIFEILSSRCSIVSSSSSVAAVCVCMCVCVCIFVFLCIRYAAVPTQSSCVLIVMMWWLCAYVARIQISGECNKIYGDEMISGR